VELSLERLNYLSSGEAQTELLKCCGSSKWANRIAAQRPFETLDELMQNAERVWWSLEPQDWLEAFRSHPKIGEKKAQAQTTATAQKWSEQEQSGITDAATTTETKRELAELNHQYEDKFGYIFIVCATGKSSEELLSLLRERVSNDTEKELRIAAAEQAKITGLRLGKLLNP
jgi:OHCU decarboxylase